MTGREQHDGIVMDEGRDGVRGKETGSSERHGGRWVEDKRTE